MNSSGKERGGFGVPGFRNRPALEKNELRENNPEEVMESGLIEGVGQGTEKGH